MSTTNAGGQMEDDSRPALSARQWESDFDARYRAEVMTLFRRAGLPEHDAQDLAQEVAIRLFRSLATFRGSCSPRTWIYRIAVHTLYDFRKRRKEALWLDSASNRQEMDDDRRPQGTPVWSDAANSPEDQVMDADMRTRVRSAIEKLTPDQRRAVLLHMEGWTDREIGDLVGKAPASIKQSRMRARESLEGLLSGVAYDYGLIA